MKIFRSIDYIMRSFEAIIQEFSKYLFEAFKMCENKSTYEYFVTLVPAGFLKFSQRFFSRSISTFKIVRLVCISSSCWLIIWTCLRIFNEVFLYIHSLLEVLGLSYNSQHFSLVCLGFLQKNTPKFVLSIYSWVKFLEWLTSFIYWQDLESHEIRAELLVGRDSSMTHFLLFIFITIEMTSLSDDISSFSKI